MNASSGHSPYGASPTDTTLLACSIHLGGLGSAFVAGGVCADLIELACILCEDRCSDLTVADSHDGDEPAKTLQEDSKVLTRRILAKCGRTDAMFGATCSDAWIHILYSETNYLYAYVWNPPDVSSMPVPICISLDGAALAP